MDLVSYNIKLISTPRSSKSLYPVGLSVQIKKAFLLSSFRLSLAPLYLLALIHLTILSERYKLVLLIVKPSRLPILIPIGPKYFPQDPDLRYN